MLVGQLIVMVRRCSVMLGVFVLALLVMMRRLMVMVRGRVMMGGGQNVTLVCRMVSHFEFSAVVAC